jgi:hypothetical protein
VRKDKDICHGNWMGESSCWNDSSDPCSIPKTLPTAVPQFLPVHCGLHVQTKLPQPFVHLPLFLQGDEAQKSRFSGHPAMLPLL